MTVFIIRYGGSLPSGDIWVTGWHVNATVAVDGALSDASFWGGQFFNGGGGTPGYLALCNAGVVWTNMAVYQLSNLAPYRTVASRYAVVNNPGTNTHPSQPQNITPLLSLRSLSPGPAGRGRMFLPPVANDQLAANGDLSTAAQDAIEAAALAAWTGTNSGLFTPVIFHKNSGTFDRIDSFNVPNVQAVQRRRVNKVTRVPVTGNMP